MPGFADQLRAFKAKTVNKLDTTVRLTVENAGERLIELSPVGDPTLWENPRSAPPGYVGGEFRSNWFFAAGAPSGEFRRGVTEVKVINGLDAMPEHPAGQKLYLSNSDPKGPSLEWGHSSQAPVGMVGVIQGELPQIAETAARKAGSQ